MSITFSELIRWNDWNTNPKVLLRKAASSLSFILSTEVPFISIFPLLGASNNPIIFNKVVNDSKQLTAKKRDELYDVIMREAVAVGIGYASPARIDEINILQATYEAMREAISKLSVKPDVLLNDAVKIPQVDIRQVPIIKGDAKSVSIAAASIVAKVTRDRLMEEYDKVLPGYGFASNKGYGSAEHIAALKEIGPSPIHRQSFIGHFV